MSGVETNPGPNPSIREQEQTDVLTELICEADDSIVKHVPRQYKPTMTYIQLTKTFKSAKISELVLTMEFLGVGGMDKYKKDTIIVKLIDKIQTLFPDDCAMCKQSYRIHYKSKPFLSCTKCKQGVHARCLASKLGVAEIDLETMTADQIQAGINPTGLSHMDYHCEFCHNAENPSEDQGLRRTKSPNSEPDPPDSRNVTITESSDTGPQSNNPQIQSEEAGSSDEAATTD